MKEPVICHIADFSPEHPGSFVDALLALACHCRETMKIKTFCIFPEEAKTKTWVQRFVDEGIHYGFISRRKNVIFQARRLLKEYDPVIFHTHFFFYDLCPIVLKSAFYWDAKIVWHYHNPPEFTFLQRLKNTVKIRLLARRVADRCIAVGDGVYDGLLKAGLPPEQIALIRNGINTRRFQPRSAVRRQARHALGVSDASTIFLLLGWDPLRKGLDIFVKAMLDAAATTQNVLFLIIGGRQTRDFLFNIPNYSRLQQTVRLIDASDDFSSILNAIDVFVSCSRSEGSPYAIAEAMGVGKVILCSDAPGMRKIYQGSQGIWFYPPEDHQMLARLIKEIMDLSPSQRDALGRMNSRYVNEHYSLEIWADSVRETYSTLVSKV